MSEFELKNNDYLFEFVIIDGNVEHWMKEFDVPKVNVSNEDNINVNVSSDNVFVVVYSAEDFVNIMDINFERIFTKIFQEIYRDKNGGGTTYVSMQPYAYDDNGTRLDIDEKIVYAMIDYKNAIVKKYPMLKNNFIYFGD